MKIQLQVAHSNLISTLIVKIITFNKKFILLLEEFNLWKPPQYYKICNYLLFVFFRNYSSWWIGHETIPSFSRATNSPRPESHLRMHMWNGWKMLYKPGIQPSMENWAQVGPFSFNFETIWDLLGPVGTPWLQPSNLEWTLVWKKKFSYLKIGP